MMVQHASQDSILVNLPWSPSAHKELQAVGEIVHGCSDHNVVVDFSDVDVAGGAIFTWLLELRQSLQDRGRKLILCSVAPATRGVFTVARLDEVFDFAKDRSAALARLQVVG